MPSSAPTARGNTSVRRIRAPIHGLLSGTDINAFMIGHHRNKQEEETSDAVAIAAPEQDGSCK